MDQLRLIDGPEEELEGVVSSIGSYKLAASIVWPTDDPTEKARYLRSCLDPSRKEKLGEREREALIVAGARAGNLGPLERLLTLCGCKPPEVLPRAEVETELANAITQATAVLAEALAKAEELSNVHPIGGQR